MNAREWLLGLVLLAGCGGHRAQPVVPSPAELSLRPLSADAQRPFVLEQRLRGRYGKREVEAHVVVQWQEGVLRLVGLAPFGARAFVVEQRGSDVHVENSLGRDLPFDPRHMLMDVQRVLFWGLGATQADGVRERTDGDWSIRETSRAGQLVERRFVPAAAAQKRAIVVSFFGPAAPVVAPRVRLVNEQLGYALEIETLMQQWL